MYVSYYASIDYYMVEKGRHFRINANCEGKNKQNNMNKPSISKAALK
jgi:hypothetical protein